MGEDDFDEDDLCEHAYDGYRCDLEYGHTEAHGAPTRFDNMWRVNWRPVYDGKGGSRIKQWISRTSEYVSPPVTRVRARSEAAKVVLG